MRLLLFRAQIEVIDYVTRGCCTLRNMRQVFDHAQCEVILSMKLHFLLFFLERAWHQRGSLQRSCEAGENFCFLLLIDFLLICAFDRDISLLSYRQSIRPALFARRIHAHDILSNGSPFLARRVHTHYIFILFSDCSRLIEICSTN